MAKVYFFQARDSVNGQMYYWPTSSPTGASGYPGPNTAEEKVQLDTHGRTALAYLYQAKDSVTGAMFHWTTSSPTGSTGYPGPNTATEKACIAIHRTGRVFLYQARDSVTAEMHYWATTSPTGATGYPGPNTAEEKACIAINGDDAEGVSIPLTGVEDTDESGTVLLPGGSLIALTGVADTDAAGTVDTTLGFEDLIGGVLTSLWFAFDQSPSLSLTAGGTQSLKMRRGTALQGIADGSSTLTYQATGWAGGGGKPSIRKGGTLSNSGRTGIRGQGLGFGTSANLRRSWTFSCVADLNESNGNFANHAGGTADTGAAASSNGYVNWNEGQFVFSAPYGTSQVNGNNSLASGPTPNRTNPFIIAFSIEWTGSQLNVRRCNFAIGGTQLYTPLVSTNANLGTLTNLANIAMGFRPFDALGTGGSYLSSSLGANDFCGWAIWDNYAASDAELLAICNHWATLYPLT